jgi:RNA recognition motif-containing protein
MAPSVVKNIKDMKKFENERGVLFNIPISDLSKWETFQSKIQKNDKKYKGYKLYEFLNTELPKIQDTESEEYKLLQQKKEEALKNRHQLELFIAGIPYDATEVDIRKYFSEKGINLFLIRILRDSSGFSKGIAFGLAENENHFDRAMKMNGEKFGDRLLRIKLADQK